MPDYDIVNLAEKVEAAGGTVPDALAALIATKQAVTEAGTVDPTADLAADLEAGKVDARTARKRVLEAAAARAARAHAHGVAADLERVFIKTGAKLAREHGDSIIESLRGPFDKACATIAEAAEALGAEPDQSVVLKAGPAASQRWHEWTDARARLDAIHRARFVLAQAGYGIREPSPLWYAAPATAHALAEVTRAATGKGGAAERLAAHGFVTHLTTADEAAAVLERIDTDAREKQRREAEGAEKARAAKKAARDARVAQAADPAAKAAAIERNEYDLQLEARRADAERAS